MHVVDATTINLLAERTRPGVGSPGSRTRRAARGMRSSSGLACLFFAHPTVGLAHALAAMTPFRAAASRDRNTGALMKVRIGIIGLPNVGKSSLFNALAQKSLAQAANFPFCTIEPNVAPLAVPDERQGELLQAFAGLERAVPATIEWVDIAGLAKGASRGEGLGNKFLGTARDCDALCHCVRTFEDPETIHVDGRVDPAADAEVVNLELLLADLAHAERRLEKVRARRLPPVPSLLDPVSSPSACTRSCTRAGRESTAALRRRQPLPAHPKSAIGRARGAGAARLQMGTLRRGRAGAPRP